MKDRIKRALPAYCIVPVAVTWIVNLAAYFLTQPIVEQMPHRAAWCLPLDTAIPFFAPFIVIYVLSYLQWIFNYLITAYEGPEVSYRALSGEILSRLVCMVIFLLFPMWMTRPAVVGNDIFSRLTRFIYSVDLPTNLFPSIHCMESWLCFRFALRLKKPPKWYAPLQLIFTLSVFASTVFVKQHVVLDIVGGVAVAELGIFLSKILHTERLFYAIEPKFVKRSYEKREVTAVE